MRNNEVRIVLVEDNPNDVELITRVFRKHNIANGMTVLKDGAEALAYLLGEENTIEEAGNAPKVILLDLKLPKVDGIEVLSRIKADVRTAGIPVVILTSSSEQWDLNKCYKLGANSYVTKPIKSTEFAKVMADVGLYWLLINKLPGQ